jgi:citrate lyase synthetase
MMKLYKEAIIQDYPTENTNIGAVFISGRMNPPTIGHQKLIDKAIEVATGEGKELFVFITRTQDKSNNPLSFEDKLLVLNTVYPDVKFVDDQSAINPFMAAYWLRDHGFTDVILVVGSDRVAQFKSQFEKYLVHPEPEKSFNFTYFRVENAGERDPDAKGAAGASATEARQLAMDGKFEAFADILPRMGEKRDQLLPAETSEYIYNQIRTAML